MAVSCGREDRKPNGSSEGDPWKGSKGGLLG